VVLTFRVLGTFQIRGPNGEFIDLPPGKKRNLVAYLLLHRGTWVANEELVDAVWPSGGPPAAAGNLKTHVHQLRKQFPGLRIEGRVGSYQLTVEPGELDADLFADLVRRGQDEVGEQAVLVLREAFELWRGEPAFGPDALIEVSRLHELRRVGGDALVDALLATGQAEGAVTFLRDRVVSDPLREADWQRLVTALLAAGRPAEALTAYHDARERLIRDLGVEPGEVLRDLHRRLLADTGDQPVGTREPAGAGRPRQRWWIVGAAIALVMLLIPAAIVVWDLLPASDPSPVADQADPGPKRQVPGPFQTAEGPKLVFGLGSDIVRAQESTLATQRGLGMLTTWYDGPQDLPLLESWAEKAVPDAYLSHRALHLIVPAWGENEHFDTKYGRSCGRRYPVSDEFFADLERVAKAFAGKKDDPPLFVSMFESVTKVSCADTNGYLADEATKNYYRALKDSYRRALTIFHTHAPNALVALNWDGWQTGWDDPQKGAGASMLTFFADEMAASDFQSLTAFAEDGNVENVRGMVEALGKYGKVMVSFYGGYEGWEFPAKTCQDDLRRLFDPPQLASLVQAGLFAWSFRTYYTLHASPACEQAATEAVTKYGRRFDN
jgi:DNA-binding SARP family transcriptional activator